MAYELPKLHAVYNTYRSLCEHGDLEWPKPILSLLYKTVVAAYRPWPNDGTTLSRVIDDALYIDETEEAAKAAKLNLNSRQKLGRIHKLLVALEAQSQRNTEVLDAHSKLLAKLADPQEAARRSGAILAKIREARGEF